VKASQYLQALDTARCNGEWDQVPELSRKVQKHAPGRKCSFLSVELSPTVTRVLTASVCTGLALTASTESKALLLKPPLAGATGTVFTAYAASLTALQDALQKELDSCTSSPLQPPAGAGESSTVTESDILQARIVLAWISSLKGEWQAALNIVPGEDEVGEGWTPSPGKSDYMNTMRIKALVVKGGCTCYSQYHHRLFFLTPPRPGFDAHQFG
jgi:hypothetical protein